MNLLKNVPGGERWVRGVVGVVSAVAGGVWAAQGELLWGLVVVASGIVLLATAVVGWCPMCAAVGRTLPKAERVFQAAKL